jgi:hypothetical protein
MTGLLLRYESSRASAVTLVLLVLLQFFSKAQQLPASFGLEAAVTLPQAALNVLAGRRGDGQHF